MSSSNEIIIELENKRKSSDYLQHFGTEAKRQALNIASIMSSKEIAPVVEPLTVSMDCPAASVGSIIGKKGANVNEIMSRSGCRVVIDQSDQRDGYPKRVNLTGPPERLAIAMSLVSLLIKDGANALFGGVSEDKGTPAMPINLTSETRCPTVKVGTIIGSKGSTIAEITRRSGCKVHIIQDPPNDGNVNERQVVYSGSLEQMKEAKVLVQSVIDGGATVLGLPALPPSETSIPYNKSHPYPLASPTVPLIVEDDIEPEKVGAVIGAKGHIISEIMRRAGCKVIVNQDFPEGSLHKVVYTGQKDQIEAAREMVLAVVTKGPQGIADSYAASNAPTIEDMSIYQKHTGKLLGPHGVMIKEIQARFGVKMNIQVSESAKGGDEMALNNLRVTGTLDSVRAAKQCVCHVLNGGTMEARFQGNMGGNFHGQMNQMGQMGQMGMFNPQMSMMHQQGHQSNQYPYDKRQNSMGRPQGSGYQGFISNGYQGQHPRDIGSSKYNHSK